MDMPILQGLSDANLIAYWVKKGATVLVGERHEDPEVLIATLIRVAVWGEGGCTPVLIDAFEAPST